MDFDISFNLTNEELSGALKTIYLFLDGINFKKSSSALYEECACRGYDKFDVAPRRVILHSSSKNSTNLQLNKSVQTFGLDDEDLSCQLQSSIHSESEMKEGLLVYYQEPFDSYTMSSKELIINVDVPSNTSTNFHKKEKPININSINFVKNPRQIKTNETYYKSHSDPTLNLSSIFSNNFSKQADNSPAKEVIGYKYLKKKLRLLEKDYKKLMGVTTEITGALQMHIMGQSENLNAMLNKCKCIYPELFQKIENDNAEVSKATSRKEVARVDNCEQNESLPDINGTLKNVVLNSPNESINTIETLAVEESVVTSRLLEELLVAEENDSMVCNKSESDHLADIPQTVVDEGTDQITNKEQDDGISSTFLCDSKNCHLASGVNTKCSTKEYFELDYKKLKADLINDNGELQLTLIIALRQIIINSAKDARNIIMNSYMTNDLLNILSTLNSDTKNIVETLFRQDSPRLQKEISRLVNTIASLKLGREYLCQSEDFLTAFLVPLVKGTYEPSVKLNSATEEMLIATVQKLSLKYRQRECMIIAGLTEYMMKFLSEKYLNVSRYCLEYATALFMNLCLHRSARERLRSFAKEVVELLAKLLNTKYEFCMPYVNGAIYSLLSDEYINEEARRQEFFELIQYHIQQTDGELRNELEHIVKVHIENAENPMRACDSTIEPEFELDILEPELDDGVNSIGNKDVLLKYKQYYLNQQGIKCLGRPVTPLERSAQKPVQLKDVIVEEGSSMSYCEETMQFYYTPTKTRIFDPQKNNTRKIKPSLFSTLKKGLNCNPNCLCHCCVGKTIPYVSDNIPIAYNIPLCYRNNYDHFKMLSNHKENRYTCNCFQLVSEDVEFDSSNGENKNNNQNRNVANRYHFCPKCQKNHQLDESNVEMCNRKNDINSSVINDGVVNFTFKELSDSFDQLRPTDEDGSGYDIVFQSRPKVLRTPP